MNNSLSVYFQAFSNKRAVFECLRSFRFYYQSEPITLVSDCGDDFSEMVKPFNLTYKYSNKNILPMGRMAGLEGVHEYLKRIHDHCVENDSQWVILMEEDVQTTRRIRSFPETAAAGPRLNPYAPALADYLTEKFGAKSWGYGMCGGSIFRRDAFMTAFGDHHDLTYYSNLDDRLLGWGDLPLTLIFQLSGFDYSVWDEVSERTHPIAPIVRDSAFDHAFKYWYGMPYSPEILNSSAGPR